jgi:hypothetical protein
MLVAGIPFTACHPDRYHLYEGPGYLQFGPPQQYRNEAYYDMADTMKTFSFVYKLPDITEDTIYFDIYAIGGIAAADRPFALTQVMQPGKANAVAGVHYKAFDEIRLRSSYVIKAGEIHAFVPVVLYRDVSLKNTEVVLQFSVAANDYFKPGEPGKVWRRIAFSDHLQQPAAWDTYASNNYWGKYSRVKHEFMIRQTGEKWDQEFMSVFTWQQAGYALYWKGRLTELLAIYNQQHPGHPLVDENGLLVTFA